MQTHLKSWQRWLVLGILMLVLTACSTKVTRPPVEAPTDSGGHWNDTDSRVTAEAMIKDALKRPWAQRLTQVTGRGPVVTVGTVVNRTHEPLNTQTFVQDLERALMNSGQVQFVADTVKPAGQEAGADFILQGTINTLVDELEDAKAVVYQVDLELVDIASNVKVWLGQKKVKKLVERSKATL